MRDKETIDTGLRAAETGHLVISTVHTKNAVQTLSRLIAIFRPEEQEIIRVRLADAITAVVSQRLLPAASGEGRVVAAEIMPVTGTIRDCIIDPERMDEIHDLIQEGREQYGSQTFDQHLMDLVHEGKVTFDMAMTAANSPSDFDLKMNILAGDQSGEKSPADQLGGFTA